MRLLIWSQTSSAQLLLFLHVLHEPLPMQISLSFAQGTASRMLQPRPISHLLGLQLPMPNTASFRNSFESINRHDQRFNWQWWIARPTHITAVTVLLMVSQRPAQPHGQSSMLLSAPGLPARLARTMDDARDSSQATRITNFRGRAFTDIGKQWRSRGYDLEQLPRLPVHQ